MMQFRIAILVAWLAAFVPGAMAKVYYPDRLDWQRRVPQQVGMNGVALDEAVKFAAASETSQPRDQALVQARSFGAREPHSAIIGPMKARAASNGLVVRRGYVVAEWGDTSSVDMTHSVTKTFLTTVVGIAPFARRRYSSLPRLPRKRRPGTAPTSSFSVSSPRHAEAGVGRAILSVPA